MLVGLFGISNDGLNLVVNLLVLFLVVVWIALIIWTYLDARRRIEDKVLVACATAASIFPFIGSMVYSILRPPEYLDDRREREIETRAAELRARQLGEQSCPNCKYPIERNYLRCPTCETRLKDPCPACSKPVDPRWAMCPYCETPTPRRAEDRRARSKRRQRSDRPSRGSRSSREGREPREKREREGGRPNREGREERTAKQRQKGRSDSDDREPSRSGEPVAKNGERSATGSARRAEEAGE